MKINPAERRPDADGPTESADETSAIDDAGPLTIALPDGSESVSEAILSHRQMLANPDEHGLASASAATDLREAVEEVSASVPDELDAELAQLEGAVDDVEERLDRQAREIEELQATVTSLAEILGASVEFETADEA
ncbi:hypothetical protein SAMN04488065_1673 [Haloplanus vescus]|uniref:Uncharacterized protein n=1 Tax=Haloplanus vescus TaxID=555874 RepID=A0A1H3Y7D3_9EURY|nr:hypothetical protein [Haloplanus vescus]SEA06814.1 hypothetical protein SAMN04488065_1673 [Haloplanus vescus]